MGGWGSKLLGVPTENTVLSCQRSSIETNSASDVCKSTVHCTVSCYLGSRLNKFIFLHSFTAQVVTPQICFCPIKSDLLYGNFFFKSSSKGRKTRYCCIDRGRKENRFENLKIYFPTVRKKKTIRLMYITNHCLFLIIDLLQLQLQQDIPVYIVRVKGNIDLTFTGMNKSSF